MELAYIGNDNAVILDRLRDADGTYINGASVELTALTDSAGVAVSGVTLPIAMTNVALSNGKYRGVLGKLAALTDGAIYRATITATGGGLSASFDLDFIARRRNTR